MEDIYRSIYKSRDITSSPVLALWAYKVGNQLQQIYIRTWLPPKSLPATSVLHESHNYIAKDQPSKNYYKFLSLNHNNSIQKKNEGYWFEVANYFGLVVVVVVRQSLVTTTTTTWKSGSSAMLLHFRRFIGW